MASMTPEQTPGLPMSWKREGIVRLVSLVIAIAFVDVIAGEILIASGYDLQTPGIPLLYAFLVALVSGALIYGLVLRPVLQCEEKYRIQMDQARADLARLESEVATRQHETETIIADLEGSRLAFESQAASLTELAEDQYALREQLQHEIGVKDRFFSIIAHDLRGPFGILLGKTKMMSQMADSIPPEKLIDFAHDVNRSGERIFDLLENLLDWARLQMDGTKAMGSDLDLSEIANQTFSVLMPVARAKQVYLVLDLEVSQAFADKHMVTTILRNLLANAIKFSALEGTVQLGSRIEGDRVILEVRDHGIGVDPEVAARLFDVDVKTTTLGTSGEVGTGLGLPLCKEMVEANQGKIWFESVPGDGTSFFIELPLKAPAESDGPDGCEKAAISKVSAA